MAVRYLFENYTFDSDRRELRRGAEMVPIPPQVFDLLDYLIRNRERVVSKDDLIRAIWNGRAVSDAALTTRLNAARNAIGDTGERQHLIKTLPRKGFRFVGTIFEDEQRAAELASLATHGGDLAKKSPSASHLSIVVLPFANLSGDPEQDYFVDGVTENLTTDLSRISGSFVIARNSAFSYKGKSVDVRQVGRELNVRYVLEGSLQRSSKRLQVNVQLVDAETANHLWADRFERPIADLFDMQDEIVSRLANTLDVQLVVAEARRAERSLHTDALDLAFQGYACLYKGPTPTHLALARDFLERALAIDPGNIRAMVGLAIVDFRMAVTLLTENKTALLSAAATNAVKALSLAPDDTSAHLVLGGVYIMTNRAAQGIAECERVLAIDRNSAWAHSAIGVAKIHMGRAAETEGHILEAFRLSPRDTLAHQWMDFVGTAKMHLGADAEATDWLRRSIEANRNYPTAHFALAAALGLLGSLDEARAAAKAGLALDPGFTMRRFRFGSSSDNPTYLAGRARVCEGLRLAEVPEG
ncbi:MULTISPECIES: winged helix-turn-helix domain-containing protein [unclassified Bradyrhizobium]